MHWSCDDIDILCWPDPEKEDSRIEGTCKVSFGAARKEWRRVYKSVGGFSEDLYVDYPVLNAHLLLHICCVRTVIWLANSAGEQFTPRCCDINQLVIKKLPQISHEAEYWCTVFQAVLGLSTTACSSCNWQSVFSYWLSGRGRGPPVWETLIDAFETSNIMVLQRIANCLKATLHGLCLLLTWSMYWDAWTLWTVTVQSTV